MSCSTCHFKTQRLIVQPWRLAVTDEQSMIQTVADLLTPAVTRSLPEHWQGSYSGQRAARWLQSVDEEAILLAVTLAASNTIAGLMILFEGDDEAPSADVRIGYLLGEHAWGQGYATELLGGLIDWARVRNTGAILAGVAENNRASRRVLEKSGFSQVAGEPEQSELKYRLVVRSITD